MGNKIEVIGGSIPTSTKIIKKDGQQVLEYGGSFNHHYIPLAGNIASIQQITEENKKSFMGKAGWGIVGGLALGGIGALAGVLAGGNKKEMTIAMEMKSGEKILATVNAPMLKTLYGFYSTPTTARHILSSNEKAEKQKQKNIEFQEKMEKIKKENEEKLRNMTPEERGKVKTKNRIMLAIFAIIIGTILYFIFS